MVKLAAVEMGVERKNLAMFVNVSDIEWVVTNSGGLGDFSPELREEMSGIPNGTRVGDYLVYGC